MCMYICNQKNINIVDYTLNFGIQYYVHSENNYLDYRHFAHEQTQTLQTMKDVKTKVKFYVCTKRTVICLSLLGK